MCMFFLTLCFSMSGLNGVIRHLETSLLQKLLFCSSAFEELGGVTKNASGYRHHFLSHSCTLRSESVSKAFNQIDLFCPCFLCSTVPIQFSSFYHVTHPTVDQITKLQRIKLITTSPNLHSYMDLSNS